MNTAKMLEEEKALEDKYFGTPEVDATTETKAPTEEERTDAAPEVEGEVTPDTTPVETEAQPKETAKREDWKKRYTNLRASRDANTYEAQSALKEANQTIAKLQLQVNELSSREPEQPVDIFKDTLSAEEQEAIGETALAAMRKTAEAAAKATDKKIKDAEAKAQADRLERAKTDSLNASQAAYDTFLTRLSSIVPDYQVIDTDPNFKKYMDEVDIDGSSRASNFNNAEARGDVATVARFFQEFQKYKNPKAAAKAKLDEKITPTGTGSSATPKPKQESDVISMADINAHYDKYAKGGYKGKQAEYLAMEKRIDAAVMAKSIRN